MAHLTGADAGFEDAVGFTAFSSFQYNAEAFGKNIPYIGEANKAETLALAASNAEFKANPYDKQAESDINASVRGDEIKSLFSSGMPDLVPKANPYDKDAESGVNADVRGSGATTIEPKFRIEDTSMATKTATATGVSGERKNVKQLANNGSDAVVRRAKKRPYVWGAHNAQTLTTSS
jgi:hypothetical protein